MGTVIPIIVATIAALTSIAAAVISARTNLSVRKSQVQYEDQQKSRAFLNEQLKNLYLPVSMHLSATRVLADTHYGAEGDLLRDIEAAMHLHNSAIVEALMTWSLYLDPDAPSSASAALLAHLLQWETVYRLKERGQWDGPVWDGIRYFGYSQFPDGAAEYFAGATVRKRQQLHESSTEQDDLARSL
jgi:hypothetical protein